MGLMEQQNKLFEELKRFAPEIVDDGISDEMQYMSAAYRVMYVLKEVNGGSGWSLCEHLRNGGRIQEHDATWDNIARWTEGILCLPVDLPWVQLEKHCRQRRKIMLPKICAINVKKTPGSYVSDGKEIYEAARQNADILKKQYELYAPDIVICCGTAGSFADACFHGGKIEWQMTARGVWYFRDGNAVIIAFSHPAARVKDCYLYYALMDAVRELFTNEKLNWNLEGS